ncbi:MAG: hypothetical protein FJ135_04315 [Deltaproteobacteria bacterium]|nr:hypothetical protein [Deltaproteobacteria bacterium]
MLAPDERSLYTAALTPPPGLVFDQAIATTYSLDPLTLLTIPVHLALGERSVAKGREDNGIMVLEGLRRVIARLSVYTQQGKIQVPASHQILFGLLETMVIEVQAPRGGVFHPKLWLLRFVAPDSAEPPHLRLLILSRNLTMDRSWDLSLQLEGQPGRRGRAVNRELADFIAALPELARNPVPAARQHQAALLAEEVRRTDWELPHGFESIRFHILGRKRRPWQPPEARRLVVISPFCDNQALAKLCEQTDVAEALISRPETLAELSAETRNRFKQCLILQEAAETEDGEDQEGLVSKDTLGLHAKAYIFQNGWHTHLVMGSANATDAALRRSENIEILVELSGKTSKVKGIDDILHPEGLGRLLEPYQDIGIFPPPDPEVQQATRALERAQKELSSADLRVFCAQGQEQESWRCHLKTQELAEPAGVAAIRAWPITVPSEYARDIGGLFLSGEALLGTFSPQALTGLIAFELNSPFPRLNLRFTLNLPVEGMPAERDAAVFRTVIRNQQGFMRYLLMLLHEVADMPFGTVLSASLIGLTPGNWRRRATEVLPLLEELVRAYCRNPNKLQDIGMLIDRLNKLPQTSEPIVPPEFLHLWQIMAAVLEKKDEL